MISTLRVKIFDFQVLHPYPSSFCVVSMDKSLPIYTITIPTQIFLPCTMADSKSSLKPHPSMENTSLLTPLGSEVKMFMRFSRQTLWKQTDLCQRREPQQMEQQLTATTTVVKTMKGKGFMIVIVSFLFFEFWVLSYSILVKKKHHLLLARHAAYDYRDWLISFLYTWLD